MAAAEEIKISWRADAARFDQQRVKTGKKKCSHDDWPSPSAPDGRITKMRAGSTHLAYKAENAVDLDTGAITAAEIDHADQADSATREDTRRFATGQIAEVAGNPLCHEGVADKGDIKNETGPEISDLGTRLRTYISEPLGPQGRIWTDKAVERTFAHLCGAAKPRAFTLVLSLGTLRQATLRTLKPISHRQPDFPMFKITYSQTVLATGSRRSQTTNSDVVNRLFGAFSGPIRRNFSLPARTDRPQVSQNR